MNINRLKTVHKAAGVLVDLLAREDDVIYDGDLLV